MPKVTITDSRETFEVSSGRILFDAIAEQGRELPHGCLSGSCGACRIIVTKGAENLAPPTVIESNTIEGIKEEYSKAGGIALIEGKSIRLSCRAKVNGDVEIQPLAQKKI